MRPLSAVISRRSLPSLLTGAVLALLYLYFFALKAHVDFSIDFNQPGRAWFKIYWAAPGEAYSEANMQQVLIDGYRKRYDLFIGNLFNIERIRVDPVDFRTKLFLHEMTVTQPGFAPIELNPENGFRGLEPVKQIEQVVAKEDGLRFNTTGRDGSPWHPFSSVRWWRGARWRDSARTLRSSLR